MAAEEHPDFKRHLADRMERIASHEIPDDGPLPPSYPALPNPANRVSFLSRPSTSFERNETSIRTATLQVIWDVMQNDKIDGLDAADQLESCKESCREMGVPFGELLSENMEPLGIPPLLYEIMRFENTELLEFLLENTPLRAADTMLRKGCMIRGDNDLFQGARARLAVSDSVEVLPYDISVVQEGEDFRIKLSIPNFPDLQKRLRVLPQDRKRPLPRSVEWIALGRLWTLNFTPEDKLILQLSDGEPISVSTSELSLLSDLSTPDVLEPVKRLTLQGAPSPTSLVPLSQAGSHVIVFYTDSPRLHAYVENGTLNLEISVRQSVVERTSEAGVDDPMDEWEQVEHTKEWVLASWSGRDEDAE